VRSPDETLKVLIVVRTYPVPEDEGVESSCTAGITEDGRWIRLFPVPYRFLEAEQQFQKYQWIEVGVTKSSDARVESYRPIEESIRILTEPLSTDKCWIARKQFLSPLRAPSLCGLVRQRNESGQPTLGFFRPKIITELLIHETFPNWTDAQLAILRQDHLFRKAPIRELEKIPYWFRYEFSCDDEDCNGHTLMCADWEMGESYRSWKRLYGDEWESKFRQRYEAEMIHKNDTHFIVGTTKAHPHTWIIIGLFYPPRTAQGEMFLE
jgi:hypothetical protein